MAIALHQETAITTPTTAWLPVNSAATDTEKRQFYRFGRDFGGDDFDDDRSNRKWGEWLSVGSPHPSDTVKRQFYRFGRGYNYANDLADRFKKEFLRFGRSAPLDAGSYFLQPGDELYRARRSADTESQADQSHGRSKRSAKQEELATVEVKATGENKELEKREADPSQLSEEKRFMRFGRGEADAVKRFMRFGKRFMRFGRDLSNDGPVSKRFMRFGRLPEVDKSFVRFGKRSGLDDDADDIYDELDEGDRQMLVALGKRFMRFGKREDGAEKRFMRFGKSGDDKRFMRFGKSLPSDIDSEKRFMRFGKRFMRFGRDGEDKRFMRFGKREVRSTDNRANSESETARV